MRGQWRYFRNRFAPAIVLMQVGKCFEIYGVHARLVAKLPYHGGKPVLRPGWAANESGLSWPMAQLQRVMHKLSKHGLAWVYVEEHGWLKGGIKQRNLRTLHLQAPIADKPAPTYLHPHYPLLIKPGANP